MKKILWVIILCFASVVNAGVIDDGFLTSGEYIEQGRLYNYDSLVVDGGGAHRITMNDYSTLEVLSTSLPLSDSIDKGVWSILMNDNSSISFSGGATNVINLYYNSTALLTGGQINYLASFQTVENDPHITLLCQDGWSFFEINNIVEGIDGKWLDGTDFHIEFINDEDYPLVYKNMNIIPEPATLALFGLGGLFLKRRRV